MRRGVVIGILSAGVIFIILAIAVVSVGSQLDQARLDRDDLEMEAEDLRSQTDSLRKEREAIKTERDALKAKGDQQFKTIEQLKVELERILRSQAQGAETP